MQPIKGFSHPLGWLSPLFPLARYYSISRKKKEKNKKRNSYYHSLRGSGTQPLEGLDKKKQKE